MLQIIDDELVSQITDILSQSYLDGEKPRETAMGIYNLIQRREVEILNLNK